MKKNMYPATNGRWNNNSKFTICSLCLVFLLILFAIPSRMFAQQLASIAGTVTDQTGAAIPTAEIQLKSAATGMAYRGRTNEEGFYTLHDVKPGPDYVLTISHNGFMSEKITGIYMSIATTRTQNGMLHVGQSVQTVSVSASSENETLDTTDATLGNSFSGAFIQELPIANRDNPSALFTQQPGMTLDGASTGSRVDQDRVTLDGLDVNDMATGNFGNIVANAPVDSVQQFRGVVAGDQADAISGGGGHFELVTKNGTNEFHGDLNEYHRDTDFTANSWFNNNTGVPRSPLIRNQFGGSLGGPILHNRLFFYFDYNGRRDTLSSQEEQTVPLDSFRNGNINYYNSAGGISTLSATQVAALDPLNIGFNPALLSLINSRYPHANDLTGGDHINTGGFRFNAPYPYKENDYVGRIDWTANSELKIFAVTHITRTNATQSAVQFPGDPTTAPFQDKSYSWVVGTTWTPTPNIVNQSYIGETYEDYSFAITYNPTGVNQFSMGPIASPYMNASGGQGRTYPIPVVRDELNWMHGKHDFMFGGNFKWPTPNEWSKENYNFPDVGLGGYMGSLQMPGQTNPLRPENISSNSNDVSLYDSAFAFALAPYSSVSANYNYNAQGTAYPQGSGLDTKYKYYEWDIYAGDSWKITPHLMINYGLHWNVFTDPYEVHGLEGVQNFTFNKYFYDRVAQSEAGISGNQAVPFIEYMPGGKANHAPGYFSTSMNNVAPTVGYAWNPAFMPNTVFNGSAGITYDQTVINAVLFQQLQMSHLFESSATNNFGTTGNAYASLQNMQRFAGLNNNVITPPAAPAITHPMIPYVSGTGANATPYGLINSEFNEVIDPSLKTPYSITYNLGMQQRLPASMILKVSYAGRLGRRLLAQADASQLIDFPDKQSGQTMSQAITNIEKYVRNNPNGQNPPVQPWFEDVLAPGSGQQQGYTNNTQMATLGPAPYVGRGDFADTIQWLAADGVLPANVGLASQFGGDTFYTNKGFSSYNAMLVTLHKNMSHGLQFDLNYTWSHSIDNVSAIANFIAINNGYGYLCDVLRPRECRGNSDFDVTNYLNGNFIYQLPFGRGGSIAGNAPYWLNEVIGGWMLSGLPSWHTGNAYNISSNAYVAGYANDAPAILTGSKADLNIHIHKANGNYLYGYGNPSSAQNDFTGPVGFQIGSRNNLRGPGYFNMDLGLGKTFPVYHNRVNLKFRADAFNAFNHPNFSLPNDTLTVTQSQFGQITSTVNSARVLQVALRLEF